MNIDENYIISLYTKEKNTLRMIAEKLKTNHNLIKRILIKNNIKITQKDRVRKSFTNEHKAKISLSSKGRNGYWKDKKMPKKSIYLNMLNHLQWEINLEWLLQFDDIERLKYLNKMLSRDRVSKNFDTEKYKSFIEKFYYDNQFIKQFHIYNETKNKYDKPSLDHIIPLSKNGIWELTNLQIISWFENRAKCDMTQQEFDTMINKYFKG
jgi:5-methylcytosine-specific restriction endonuclease McrA